MEEKIPGKFWTRVDVFWSDTLGLAQWAQRRWQWIIDDIKWRKGLRSSGFEMNLVHDYDMHVIRFTLWANDRRGLTSMMHILACQTGRFSVYAVTKPLFLDPTFNPPEEKTLSN